jgi:hypothetical protein
MLKDTFRKLVILAMLLSTGLPLSARARPALQDNPTSPQSPANARLYLPLVTTGRVSPATSIELIDEDVAGGRISAEQGLIYKVYAVWGDSRLPAPYRAALRENDGDGVMRAVAQVGSGLSPSARLELTPFFLPPNDPGSWWKLQHPGSGAEGDPVDSWQSLSAASGKIKVWYFTGEADSARQAGVVKAALDGKIWPAETTLMNRQPKYGTGELSVVNIYLSHSYTNTDGISVPFNGTRGVALAQDCRDTPTWIYINNTRPDGSEFSPGMIQTVAHELFHAFQNSYNMAACAPYDWLAEATAKWVEDHIYPDADSEWPYAPDYLDFASRRLDDQTDAHHYGAYLFPFYLTHQFNDPTIVRRMWENSQAYPNSYLAIKNAVPAAYQDYYWGSFLMTLWNKAPFVTFFQEEDGFTGSVKPEAPAVVSVTAPQHEFVYPLAGDLPTGGVRYYHFTFPDSSVRSLAIVDGLANDLRQDSTWNSQYGSEFTEEADQTYASDPLTEEEQQGLVMFALVKVAGKSSWDFLPIAITDSTPYCADTRGKLEELVVVLSNGDFDHPDRVVSSPGLDSMLVANNMPCASYQGTSRISLYNDGVTLTYSASNILYQSYAQANISDITFPYIYFYLQRANVAWTIGGTDSSGCVYHGNGSFTVGPHPGAGSDAIVLYSGVLPGGPSYRGYQGGGSPDEGEMISYTYTCDGYVNQYSEPAYTFLEIPIFQTRSTIKVGANGVLSGSYREDGTSGDWTEFQWNLAPGP